MSETSKPRPLPDLLEILEGRWAHYLSLAPLERAQVDHDRWVPTPEMHDILNHLFITGGFIDEPKSMTGPREGLPRRLGPGFG